MGLWSILLVAFGVSVDAAAVSTAGALSPGRWSKPRRAASAALFFGGFQFIMPVAGYFAAGLLSAAVAAWDRFLACGLLVLVGGKMLWESHREVPPESGARGEFFAPGNMVIPAVATSIDALFVGAGIAFAGRRIWLPAAAMGVATAAVSAGCVLIGTGIGRRIGSRPAGIAGGVAIILVGIGMLMEH